MADRLMCLFSAEVTQQDGRYVVEVPDREVELGAVREGEPYRAAVLPADTTAGEPDTSPDADATHDQDDPEPPVEEGERREVDIEDMGEQGDGITRVERGYVVIIPDTTQGERVTIEITDVQRNVAFAEVLERQSHF